MLTCSNCVNFVARKTLFIHKFKKSTLTKLVEKNWDCHIKNKFFVHLRTEKVKNLNFVNMCTLILLSTSQKLHFNPRSSS